MLKKFISSIGALMLLPNVALSIPDFWKPIGFETRTDAVVCPDYNFEVTL